MTETVKPPCVRGCTRPVTNPDTREKTGDEPRPADEGLLCRRCADRLKRSLQLVYLLYQVLDSRPSSGTSIAAGKRTKLSGSPALIRLDVAILQDPRSSSGAWWDGKMAHEPEDINDPPSDIPGQFIAWAHSFSADLQLTEQIHDLRAAIKHLTGPWFSNLCHRPWIGDLYDDAQEAERLLRRVTGLTGPEPLGRCGCGQMLYKPEPIPGAAVQDEKLILECRRCGHRLNALAVVRLKAAQGMSE